MYLLSHSEQQPSLHTRKPSSKQKEQAQKVGRYTDYGPNHYASTHAQPGPAIPYHPSPNHLTSSITRLNDRYFSTHSPNSPSRQR